MKEVRPHIVLTFPVVEGSDCQCSFCILVFMIDPRELTDDDKAKYVAHLRLAHGLKDEIIP
jgi:hypothetical protein